MELTLGESKVLFLYKGGQHAAIKGGKSWPRLVWVLLGGSSRFRVVGETVLK